MNKKKRIVSPEHREKLRQAGLKRWGKLPKEIDYDKLRWEIGIRIMNDIPEINHNHAYKMIGIFFDELKKNL